MTQINDRNRILEMYKDDNSLNKKKFMPFFVVGDPNIDQFKDLMRKVEPFADIFEIGIPFSDPIADGPTIQEANHRAFKAGINTDIALKTIKEVREITQKPIVILTYYNILIQGSESIEKSLEITFKDLKESGVDGIVIADLPIEEAELALKFCKKYNILLIFLIAPTTTEQRLNRILKVARGFLYLITVMGTTGSRKSISKITEKTIKRIKNKTENSIPIYLGFGISKPAHASKLVKLGADGIIIGSAIINIIKENLGDYNILKEKVVDFVSSIKNVIDK
ncbi:MAG: tryptophan synthase subunit alpha [Candidatus Lokiarchaeota archaeon]|nr:tryptophan synthase subunit alpha [Candidatus Lokiarchaeota archaeon]